MVRGLVVSLALLGCRPQPGPTTAASEGSPMPVAAAEVAAPAAASPPRDSDGDGIADASDRCPDEPEDRDQFEDEDGCVDRDNDRDTIPDAYEFKGGRWTNCDRTTENGVELDCRNRPEDVDGVRDHDGCPDMLRISQCTRNLGRVHFDRRGKLAGGAAKMLGEVAAVMAAAPDVMFWVHAHTDNQGDAAAAKRLTGQVAEQVIAELVRLGIARERLEPIGWGNERPYSSNATAKGRADNRRVEFEVKLDSECEPIRVPEATRRLEMDCR